MFVRFRQTKTRVQASLVETRRLDGKVRYEHIASLGSVPAPPSIADRVAFWKSLHERLARLANRVDAEAQGKIFAAIHARIPMPLADEQRALQLENAKADAQFWDRLDGLYAGTVADQKGMIARVERTIADNEAQRSQATERSARAKDRIAKIERGENVDGGLAKPMDNADLERILRAEGVTKKDIARDKALAMICQAFGDENVFGVLISEISRRQERVKANVQRDLLKLLSDKLPPEVFKQGMATLLAGGHR